MGAGMMTRVMAGVSALIACASTTALAQPQPWPNDPRFGAAGQPDWWEMTVLGNTPLTWGLAIVFATAALIGLLVARAIVRDRLDALAKARPGPVSETLARLARATWAASLIVVALAIGALQLELTTKAGAAVRVAVVVAVALQVILWGRVAIDVLLERLIKARTTPDGKPDPSLLSAMIPLKFVSTLVLVAVVALLALDNAGVNITAMVAGLGIGGIAIALAVQSILGDLFSAVSIVIDKPFVVGDFIIVGDKMGTVETIGLKTTRLRALGGEQLIFANSDLLSSRIQNFKRMQERRVVIAIGVTYQTSVEDLRRIPGILREAVEHNAGTRFDRCHFKRMADYFLEFELVYYVCNPDMLMHLDIQQNVLLEVYDRFGKEGIDFAYPTQTSYEFQIPMAPPVKRTPTAEVSRPAPRPVVEQGLDTDSDGVPDAPGE
jgi:small-conductance mechanosensitive channel